MSGNQKEQDQYTGKVGARMTLIAWIFMLGIMTLIFGGILKRQTNPNSNIQSLNNGIVTEIILRQNRAGHYVATAEINDVPVDVIVDTGATNVSVPLKSAQQLGLKQGPGMEVTTANGTITVYSTRIETIKLGDIVLNDVRASINPFMEEDVILLGMSFLDQIEFSHSRNELVLRQALR